MSQGETKEEALRNIKEAIGLYLEVLEKDFEKITLHLIGGGNFALRGKFKKSM
ncbi:hypothetical protein TERMP_02222 (plasmid) [Thermococcus barophilus MP]|uniref:HicB-like antitoxin of toxin-antitoxin system domain-containing protein n=1 Tax=Thermococcus barophilus (strain DSM 11836 / MP) TaxID=391623 RepID=F0LN56_THEBM|nr:hypothetical protein TERMP_02222 [Thermococcus barophilus MP]